MKAAATLGALGGAKKSEKKTAAARRNSALYWADVRAGRRKAPRHK